MIRMQQPFMPMMSNQGMFNNPYMYNMQQFPMFNQGMFSPYTSGFNFPSQFGGVSYPQFNMGINPYAGMSSGVDIGGVNSNNDADPFGRMLPAMRNQLFRLSETTGRDPMFLLQNIYGRGIGSPMFRQARQQGLFGEYFASRPNYGVGDGGGNGFNGGGGGYGMTAEGQAQQISESPGDSVPE